MKATAGFISTYASDASGVASAMYELGGLTVIHDASGCNSTYNTHDEPRWFDMDSMVYISAVTEIEAILGDDSRWISDLIETARELKPRFITLCGSPIPMMIGTDFEALAAEVEEATGIPTFGIPTNGMHSYIWGASQAFEALASRMVEPVPKTPDLSVNLLGLTPLDFSIIGMDESVSRVLEAAGITVISRWAMRDTLDAIRQSSAAHVNVVVSESGLAAAKVLEARFGIPYVAGLPFGETQTQRWLQTIREAAADRQSRFVPEAAAEPAPIQIIGEGVAALSLAQAIRDRLGEKVQVLCATEPEGAVADRVVDARDEAELLPHLASAEYVIADPLYRPIIPTGAVLIEWPHEGFSGRIYRSRIPDLVQSIDPILSCMNRKETKNEEDQ